MISIKRSKKDENKVASTYVISSYYVISLFNIHSGYPKFNVHNKIDELTHKLCDLGKTQNIIQYILLHNNITLC